MLVMLSAKLLSLATKLTASAAKAGAPGSKGATVSMVMVRETLEAVPLATWLAVTNRLCKSPPKAVTLAEVNAAVVQLPPVAVTLASVTLAPVILLVRATVTVAPSVAVPLMVGVSEPLMMSSVAILALMVMGVAGVKLLSTLMSRLTMGELTPARVCRAVTVTVPTPKIAMSAVIKEAAVQVAPVVVAVLLTVAPALLLNNTVTTAPETQVPDTTAVAPVTSLRLTESSPAILALMTGAARLSTAMVLLLNPEVTPAKDWVAPRVTLPAPKVANSAELKLLTLQVPLATVAVLVTDCLAALVKVTLTVAPVTPVPLTLALPATASAQLTLSLPAIFALIAGAANVVSMVAA
jgi:hypothetical protein